MNRLERLVTQGCYLMEGVGCCGAGFAPEVSVVFDSCVRVIVRGLTPWEEVVFEVKLTGAFKEDFFRWLWDTGVPSRTHWESVGDMERAFQDVEFFQDSALAEHLAERLAEVLTVFVDHDPQLERTRVKLVVGDDPEQAFLDRSFQESIPGLRFDGGQSRTRYVLYLSPVEGMWSILD